ncbi:NADPH-dependent FMN reductase, partial [Streptomyces anulatus]|uniref:NADPH-dependent FMN reductase n=1 Tax=Streptomyces anulatus TaxID=1892 RepID=UPI0036970A26
MSATVDHVRTANNADAQPSSAHGRSEGAGTPNSPLRLAVVIGSTREGRFGPTIAHWFVRQAALRDAITVDVVDTASIELPRAFGAASDHPSLT